MKLWLKNLSNSKIAISLIFCSIERKKEKESNQKNDVVALKTTLNLFKKLCGVAQEIYDSGLGEIFITVVAKGPEGSSEELTADCCRKMRIDPIKEG